MPDTDSPLATLESDLQKATTDAAAVEAQPAPVPPTADAISAIIDPWFVAAMHGTIVSQNTDIYNHVRAAVDDLKARLIKELVQ